MASSSIRPCLVVATQDGNIYDRPELLMICRHGREFALPRPDELIPLPDESALFLLPGRRALGFDPASGRPEQQEEWAVAAFAAPAYTLTAHPAYVSDRNAPVLPLFAYGAVGFANNRFYICAKKVDEDQRQVFSGISPARIRKKAEALMRRFPKNRLIQHLAAICALIYNCPAARNLCLGRYEAPLPVSRTCNARCIGCISRQEEGSPLCSTPQKRMLFTPTAEEIVEVMDLHAANERKAPIYSFGQGCEGEPLTESALLIEAVRRFRGKGGRGTINLNSNASLPESVTALADAGLSSLRVSLNSARDLSYSRYFRPHGYGFSHVRQSIRHAKAGGIHISLNLLYFPGFSDTEAETAALLDLINKERVDCLQLRNLNIDPEYYLNLMHDIESGPSIGFLNFRKRLKKECPWLHVGYFNPPTENLKENKV
ncbi:MAG: radical SAM protein [Desulfovibrio sp.]|jgi:pyruvate-formate lyase-activating enzyme|nr:radical SAM protein [Desulfovibrio sp.]